MTIGVEFGTFGLKLNGKVIKLQIWDTVSIIEKLFRQEVPLSTIMLILYLGWPRVIQVGDENFLQGRPLRLPDLRYHAG